MATDKQMHAVKKMQEARVKKAKAKAAKKAALQKRWVDNFFAWESDTVLCFQDIGSVCYDLCKDIYSLGDDSLCG